MANMAIILDSMGAFSSSADGKIKAEPKNRPTYNMSNIDRIHAKINQLYRLRERLLLVPLAPPNIWISQYKISREYPDSTVVHTYIYAKWEALEPIFERKKQDKINSKASKYTKHQHIGRVSSTSGLPMDESVKQAYIEQRNRRWLDRVESAINKIESAISNF
jgi:hypothetical protein